MHIGGKGSTPVLFCFVIMLPAKQTEDLGVRLEIEPGWWQDPGFV